LILQLFLASIITSPAFYVAVLGGKTEKVPILMYSCCKTIVEFAIQERNYVLILGVLGCGVFGNDPKMIGDFFKQILIDENYVHYFDMAHFLSPEFNREKK
jgi:uncharacterized protein (TIGR02452 family)